MALCDCAVCSERRSIQLRRLFPLLTKFERVGAQTGAPPDQQRGSAALCKTGAESVYLEGHMINALGAAVFRQSISPTGARLRLADARRRAAAVVVGLTVAVAIALLL
jgi:hypothetical protein